jgi:hypothetical protein
VASTDAVIKRRVDALIANEGTRWTEDDRHMLLAQDEAFLIRLEAQPRAVVTHVRQPETVTEAIATLPSHLQEPMQAMAQEYEVRKSKAMAMLAANDKCPFAPEELQAMTAQRLEQLVEMSGQAVAPIAADPYAYAGRGMPYVRPASPETEVPEPRNTFALVVERQRQMGRLVH